MDNLKVIFYFFCTLRFKIFKQYKCISAKYCRILTSSIHTSMESLFIQLQMMYNRSLKKLTLMTGFVVQDKNIFN